MGGGLGRVEEGGGVERIFGQRIRIGARWGGAWFGGGAMCAAV